MSEYFQNFPLANYDINKNKPADTTLSVNLLTRLKLKEAIEKNVLAYYPYQVKPGERPDVIAYNYYGSTAYTWLIFLANNIFDPLHEWPLFGVDFENYIKDKYGSVSSAQTTLHHYEQILSAEINESADNPKVLEKVVVIDKTTYDSLNSSERRIIYNYDYEVIERERKRSIVLIEDIYAQQVLDEARKFYK